MVSPTGARVKLCTTYQLHATGVIIIRRNHTRDANLFAFESGKVRTTTTVHNYTRHRESECKILRWQLKSAGKLNGSFKHVQCTPVTQYGRGLHKKNNNYNFFCFSNTIARILSWLYYIYECACKYAKSLITIHIMLYYTCPISLRKKVRFYFYLTTRIRFRIKVSDVNYRYIDNTSTRQITRIRTRKTRYWISEFNDNNNNKLRTYWTNYISRVYTKQTRWIRNKFTFYLIFVTHCTLLQPEFRGWKQ